MVPEGTQTRVTTESHLRYQRKVPKNWVEYMDAKVQEASVTMSDRSREAITSLMDRNKNKKFFIPLVK